MAGGFVFALPLLALVACLAVVWWVVPRRRALVAVDEAAHPGLARLRRSTLVGRLLALVAGATAAVVTASTGGLGRGFALAPAAFAAVLIVGVLAADLAARDDARTPGTAGLEVRRVRDLLAPGLVRLAATVGVVLAVFLGWAGVVAVPDDLGRAGRALTYNCVEGCDFGTLSPWPGSYYSVPMAAALLGVLLLAGIAVGVTVRRPRNGASPEIVAVDDVVRRRSVESALAAVGVAFTGSLAGTALLSGVRLAGLGPDRGPVALQVAGWVLLLAGLAALVCLVWCLVVLLLPGASAGAKPSGRSLAAEPERAHG
ncbi:hypothetical protein SAMN05421678_10226 [Actinopolymorpha cephalotaxi]|uniref:Uncharacterized protein n=1 Tax=Actinopolymorpha cephalotaxi TaxID=504797 RepID=A0A1I2LBS0_9ACTN|nr:hypothetical protein [Actinopolymorpha cephalotaxi]NYH85003.1 hypothetical protein [Actinopolymorpha cephalotaxi]SFF75930.1 hypothetical protein SAMN05421678_10226 [Actinopolymorpha cephalotaxi]